MPVARTPASTERCTRPAAITLVLVPISVQRPPRIVAKLSGISSFDGGMRNFLPHSVTAGSMAATSGVLFMNAERPATGSIMRSCAPVTVFG